MSAARHTPEPWSLRQAEQGRGRAPYIDIYVADQHSEHYGSVASVSAGMSEKAQANAARIVACINACEGIEDPEADIRGMQSACASLAVRLGQVERQRDALAAIVSEFEAIAWDGCPRRREEDDLCIRARAALKAMHA